MDKNNPNSKIRLRPVVYGPDGFRVGAQNTAQQMLLLKALQVTQDPEKLRDLIHATSVAQVFQTLDKLAMRKEYHDALARSGLSFDTIVAGIKKIAETGYKDSDKLSAYKTLLKSLGMDDYKTDSIGVAGTWEEALLKKIEEKAITDGDKKAITDGGEKKPIIVEYEVNIPEIPESARKLQEEEEEVTSSIYDGKK